MTFAVSGGGLLGTLVAAVVTLTLTWVALVAALAIARPDGATVADAVHLLRSITCSKSRVTLRGQPSLVSHLQDDDAEPGQADEEDDSREDLLIGEVEQ